MDVGSGLSILGGAVASKELILKILGPTADYIGKCVRDWTEHRIKNVNTIFKKAGKKLGRKIEESGSVHPKVLKLVLDEGSFCDDDLTKEYFAGVLASSRSSVQRDDRGAYFLRLVDKLSNYQIRTHYIFYTLFKKLYKEALGNLSQGNVRRNMRIHLPIDTYAHAMDFDDREEEFEIATHSLDGLMREQLIDKGWSLGFSENYSELGGKSDLPYGIIYASSITGIELYLWAMGMGSTPINSFFECTNNIQHEQEIEFKPGAIQLKQNKSQDQE